MKFFTKLKYIEIKPIYIVLVVVLAVIIRFWGENSITLLQKDVPEINTTEISKEEIENYITVKELYLSQDFTVDWQWAMRSNLEEVLDKDIHEWFLINKWRPARFVYVQDRIKKILEQIKKREASLLEADRLDQQAKQFAQTLKFNPHDSVAEHQIAKFRRLAKDIRYYQNRDIRVAGITEEEEKSVLTNRQIIEEILEK